MIIAQSNLEPPVPPKKFSLFFSREREDSTTARTPLSFRHHHARHTNNKNGIRVAIIRVSRNERSDRVDEQQRYALNSHRAGVVSFTNSSSSFFFMAQKFWGQGLERETARARRCHRLRRGNRMRWFPIIYNAWILFRSRHRGFVGRVGPFFARLGTSFFALWVRRVRPPHPRGRENLKAELYPFCLKEISLSSLSRLYYTFDDDDDDDDDSLTCSIFSFFFTSPSTTVQQKISRTTVSATPSSINQIGFQTPPSTGEKPSWDAIIEVGGSQQFVSEGRYYECHSLPGLEPGSKVAFERVLATRDTDKPTFGQPYVKGARVEATVLENYKDEKVIVFKYRPKKHYRRKNGHRQHMTRFLVTKVIKA